MPGKNKSTASSEPLEIAIPKIFDQVQNSTANHGKNYVALRKLHVEAAAQVKEVQKGRGLQLVGEKAFQDVFLNCMLPVLSVKKGVFVADRVVRFIGSYVKFICTKADEEAAQAGGSADEDEDDRMEHRFVKSLLDVLFGGFIAKDKAVRFRSLSLVAEMVSHLGEVDEDLYLKLRALLLDRLNDKEAPVRLQAVLGLSKLCGSETEEDMDEGEQTATETLLDVLSQDPAADVRRAVLLNIPVTASTLPGILDRTRDTDASNRRLVYNTVLMLHAKNLSEDEKDPDNEAIGIAHPRALQISQRELIVRQGMGDREPQVRVAASKLLVTWLEVAADAATKQHDNVEHDVIAFLRMFDLGAGSIAEDALSCIFADRPDILDALAFSDTFWGSEMIPEKAALARIFTKYCVTHGDQARLDGNLPVVTALAFRIQADFNDVRERLEAERRAQNDDGEDDDAAHEDARLDREFVLGEMLQIATYLDYGDEIGRRRMFQLVKDMISQESLPPSLTSKCLDVLSKLTPNEKELIRIVVEVVHELRDPVDDENEETTMNGDETTTNMDTSAGPRKTSRLPKTMEERTPEEQHRVDAIDLQCLNLSINMLERVNSTFEENSTLEGLMKELIVPSVYRKEVLFREKALIGLGLCCLIARKMAQRSLPLFLKQATEAKAPQHITTIALQAIFDLLMVHEQVFLVKGSELYDNIVTTMLGLLAREDAPDKIEALICTGLSKLVLSRMITDDRILQHLILTYVSPHSADNQELRQCLSYFLPVFCYSSGGNQQQMQKLFIPTYEIHMQNRQGDKDMIPAGQFAMMFVDWTDPQKAVGTGLNAPDEKVHFDLAADIIKGLLSNSFDKEYKKALCQALGKLHIPAKIDDDDKVRTLKLLVHWVQSRRPLKDTVAKNAIARFDAMLSKRFDDQLKDFSEEEYRKLEDLQELFTYLDDVIPLDDEDEEPPRRRTAQKRRSESVASRASDDDASAARKRKPVAKKGAKRRRLSTPEDSGSEEEPEEDTPRAPRSLPKRAAASKRQSLAEPNPDDFEEEDEEDTSQARPSRPRSSRKVRQEEKLDEELDELLDSDDDRPTAPEPDESVIGDTSEED